MIKDLKEKIEVMNKQINLKKETETIKKNQMKILEIKSAITEMKDLLDRLTRNIEVCQRKTL